LTLIFAMSSPKAGIPESGGNLQEISGPEWPADQGVAIASALRRRKPTLAREIIGNYRLLSNAGAGTDRDETMGRRTKGPVIVLVEPQLAENIGAVARAMGNFALSELRLVKPRDGWPNPGREPHRLRGRPHSGGSQALSDARRGDRRLYARDRGHRAPARPGQAEVVGPEQAARDLFRMSRRAIRRRSCSDASATGSRSTRSGLANKILTLPVNPAFASLNLGQAVIICAYEFYKLASGNALAVRNAELLAASGEGEIRSVLFATVVNALEQPRILPAAGKAREHDREPAQHLPAPRADRAGYPDAARRDPHARAGREGPATGGILRGGEAELLRDC
jgi:tRNA/rRNA methyltransferase